MKTIPQAKTIDEVILLLNEIIKECIKEKSTLGYFPRCLANPYG